MVSDHENYRAANQLNQQHGNDAAMVAAKRADEMLDKGDMEGFAIWQRIAAAAENLLRQKPVQGEADTKGEQPRISL